jgi:hypothetical protein
MCSNIRRGAFGAAMSSTHVQRTSCRRAPSQNEIELVVSFIVLLHALRFDPHELNPMIGIRIARGRAGNEHHAFGSDSVRV